MNVVRTNQCSSSYWPLKSILNVLILCENVFKTLSETDVKLFVTIFHCHSTGNHRGNIVLKKTKKKFGRASDKLLNTFFHKMRTVDFVPHQLHWKHMKSAWTEGIILTSKIFSMSIRTPDCCFKSDLKNCEVVL